MREEDLMPSPQTMAALGIAQASRAYKIAKMHASRGVPPEIAARHAVPAAARVLDVWLGVIPPAVFVALFYHTANPRWLLWQAALFTTTFVMWHRMRLFVDTDPRLRIRYRIPTWLWIAAWVIVWAGGILGAMTVYTSQPGL